MSDIKYSRRYKEPQKQLQCDHCSDGVVVGKIHVAVSWFRGDDEVVFLCKPAFDQIKRGREDDVLRDVLARREGGGDESG